MISHKPKIIRNLRCIDCQEISENVELLASQRVGWGLIEEESADLENQMVHIYGFKGFCPNCMDVYKHVAIRNRRLEIQRNEEHRVIYADPVAKRIFDEFEARLVEVRK